ncbi:MAG: helix-turn-helix domain-containing protein [Candidatus Latescibacterota bacterium]
MSRGALDSSQRPPDIIDEHTRLKDAMQLTGGNLSAAARNLGMKRFTLHDRLQRHGIRRVAQS